MNPNPPTSYSFRRILLDHAARYPDWQIEDLYKLIHQAALGSEHAVTGREQARCWLDDELAHLDSVKNEPLIDPIAEGGSIVRVHLRPLVENHLLPSQLLDAFLRTSREFRGSIQRLDDQWQQAVLLSSQGLLDFDPVEMISFYANIRSQGYPAVHHSDIYNSSYHPAYRVVAVEFLPPEWK